MNHTHTNASGGHARCTTVMGAAASSTGNSQQTTDTKGSNGSINAVEMATSSCTADVQAHGTTSDHRFVRPSFLRMELDDLHVETYTTLNEQADSYLQADTLQQLYVRVIGTIESTHGYALASDVLGLLWASRRGLSEREIAGISGRSLDLVGTICGALAGHLVRRNGTLSFGHDDLRAAVEGCYAADEAMARLLHTKIASWFNSQVVDVRRAEEQPWQLLRAGAIEDLHECIVRIPMFEALQSELSSDLSAYWMALENRYDMALSYEESLARHETALSGTAEREMLYSGLAAFMSEAGRRAAADNMLRRLDTIRRRRGSVSPINGIAALSGRRQQQIAASQIPVLTHAAAV